MSTVELPERMRISVERHLKMVAPGVLTEDGRVELIEGDRFDQGNKRSWYEQRTTFAPGDLVSQQAMPAVQVAVGPLFS